MHHSALMSVGARGSVGHGVWSVVAFAFPTLAAVKDDSVIVAILLFVLETLLASAVLFVRTLTGARGANVDDPERRRVLQVGRALQFFVVPFSLGCLVMFGLAALFDAKNRQWHPEGLVLFGERAGWMAALLLAGAVLDTLLAPVRSARWLETAVAWQGSRTSVMIFVLVLGWPVMLLTGTSQAYFWLFFAFRLLTDLNSLWPGQRERIRANMFDGPIVAEATLGEVGTPPPQFSQAHARHDRDDPAT